MCTQLADEVYEVVCLWAPESFSAVVQGYRDFRTTTDDEVRAALAHSAAD